MIAVAVTILVLAILIMSGYAVKYFKDFAYDDQIALTMSKLPTSAYDQKEFPKPYMEWLAKYCVPENSGTILNLVKNKYLIIVHALLKSAFINLH